MTHDQIIETLKRSKRAQVARATGLRPMYLYRIEKGLIKNPGALQIDRLRAYFEAQQTRQ